jgi:hypothetical protein
MVCETRPYKSVHLDFSLGGAGFLYCWFMAEMVCETRPYKLVHFDFSLGGRVFYIVGLWQRWFVKPAPTNRFFWIPRWAGAGFLYCWFIPEMVGQTRPYTSVFLDFSLGGAGFLYCWFIAEMVGETRPYKSVHWDLSLGGGGFFILLIYGRDGW